MASKQPVHPLSIQPIKTQASKLKSPPTMEALDLKHPFSLASIGVTGSGKTCAILNLLTNQYMYGRFFEELWLFSATGVSDDSFQVLRLPPSRIITSGMEAKLKRIVKSQKKEVETKGKVKAKKVCIVFEDLTANKKLMRSKTFLECFVQNRHLGISTIACCHKYHALIRTARLNANQMWIFPASSSEMMRIATELGPPGLSTGEFMELIQFAWDPEPNMSHPFLWVNRKVPIRTRFRKSLSRLLVIGG